MQRIAVFASGTGSNFQALMDAQAEGKFADRGEIALLVTDKPTCGAVSKAERANMKVAAFTPKEFASKAEYELEILHVLDHNKIDWIVLAGYMRLIGPGLLAGYPHRIINLHPSLLPAFAGKDAIGQAYAYGAKVAGVTIHFVDHGMDTGPIIRQQSVAIEANDTIETLTRKIQAVEHQLLPATVADLLTCPIEIVGRTVTWKR